MNKLKYVTATLHNSIMSVYESFILFTKQLQVWVNGWIRKCFTYSGQEIYVLHNKKGVVSHSCILNEQLLYMYVHRQQDRFHETALYD